jgi:hypothetical protein
MEVLIIANGTVASRQLSAASKARDISSEKLATGNWLLATA